ncbi:hypothetical protein TNIN_155081 [Trichonephila inaurata madagascariensis]|uniref:Uncharacterized protein n=1 Tax=Trichonephila inaurata madagascariensis TaxID=2747483 RepID=A0A8X6Y9L1_9ARAC|nr:hypothetical protein TNIN_155081 [Trichonephila inaurata madagascariensis]
MIFFEEKALFFKKRMQGFHCRGVRRNAAFMGDVHLPAENNEGVSMEGGFYGEGFMRNAHREPLQFKEFPSSKSFRIKSYNEMLMPMEEP